VNGKTENDSWRTMGIIGSCRSVGVTHLAVWTANYLTGVRRERTAVLEWNTHGDFDRMGQFCKGDGKKGLYRILEVDYYAQAGMEELADCLNKDYQYIIVDYGEITGHKLLDCARCDLKVIVGSLSEWQAKMFSGAVTEDRKRDKSWRYAVAFGSEEARKRMERCFRIQVQRIPDSRDVFAVTHADIGFFTELLED
jgi:hypothetical protein